MKKCLFITLLCLFCYSFNVQAQNTNLKLIEEMLELPAPRPGSVESESAETQKKYPPEFYDPNNPPLDDAPLEQILDYWQHQNSEYDVFRYSATPSKATLERILNEIEDDSDLLPQYLSLLPPEKEIADSVKRLYENRLQSKKIDSGWLEAVKRWLKYNSDMFSDELLREARQVKYEGRYLQNQEELISLAIVAWDQALPLIENIESDDETTATYTLAKYIRYHKALREADSRDTNKYRRQLMDIVENKKATEKSRDLAMDALVLGGDFEGRDDWYLTLLSDETLLDLQENGFTGLTTLPKHTQNSSARWVPEMTRLLASDNKIVRSAAVRNLMQIRVADKEALKLMIPWLTDKDWANESDDEERGSLISLLGEIEIPEAVPGLIAVIMNEDGGIRARAAVAVALYRAPQAVPALRYALENETDNDYRKSIISGLIGVGGLTAVEQVAALEAFAVLTSTKEGSEKLEKYKYSYGSEDRETVSPQITIGEYISEIEEPADALVLRTIERIKYLRRSDPPTAAIMLDILQGWNNRFVDLEMLRWIETGTADLDSIIRFLWKRKAISENIPNELYAMHGKGGIPSGISAVILSTEGDLLSVLTGRDREAKAAMLAAARLVRAELPVMQVGMLLESRDELIALAAERYLEAEDSTAARTLILNKFPADVRILGARWAFIPDSKKSYSSSKSLNLLFQSVNGTYFYGIKHALFDENEQKLREEIKQNENLLAIYSWIDATGEQIVIRAYKNKILYTLIEDEAHFRVKELTPKQYERFYRFLLENDIDKQPPAVTSCHHGCPTGEFLMFGRSGGRRIFHSTYSLPEPLTKLRELLTEFGEENTELKYRLAEDIEGLDILLADKDLVVHSVWKNGDDFRVLVEDLKLKSNLMEELAQKLQILSLDESVDYEQTDKMRREMFFDVLQQTYSWRNFSEGKLSRSQTAQPVEIRYLTGIKPAANYYYTTLSPGSIDTLFGDLEVRTSYDELSTATGAGETRVIKEGRYGTPLITPDGRWIIAGKSESYDSPVKIVRIEKQTGRETEINLPEAELIFPAGYLKSHGKVLLASFKALDISIGILNERAADYFLLDPATGSFSKVKGEFSPIMQRTYRELQPTGKKPFEFWAAVYDKDKNQTEIGKYNERDFTFEKVLTVPKIKLSSMDIWIDAAEAKVYFTYKSEDNKRGHLLSLPLPQN